MKFLTGKTLLLFILLFSSVASYSQAVSTGFASTYPQAMEGMKTASGELYFSTEFTACHSSLPFNTLVKVTNLKNNKSITVRINDRFAYRNSRVVDISNAAADAIDLFGEITPQVSIQVIGVADATMMAAVAKRQAGVTTTPVVAAAPAPEPAKTVAATTPAKKQEPAKKTVSTQTATVAANAPAGKKETPDLLSSIGLSIPTISLEDVNNLAVVSIKYLALGLFK